MSLSFSYKERDDEIDNNMETAFAAGTCPYCGGKLVERESKYGPFWGCKNYPHCRFTASVDPNTGEIIMKGQLMNAYVANANAAGNDSPDLHRMQSLHRKIGRWIEAALYHPYDKELQELKENISSRENMLNGSNAMFQAFKAKMSPEQLKKFEDGLRQDLAKDKARYSKVMQDRDELETRVGNNHIDYFFRTLEVQLHDTIKRLDSCGQAYTLLPQDLIQEDIENCFGGVPSPEADFQ